MRAPSAVLFDAYGTLFDVGSVEPLADMLFPGHGSRIASLWRDKQIEYSRLLTTTDEGAHYQPFSEITLAALRYTCRQLALRLDQVHELALMDHYFHLDAYAEAREVLTALHAAGVVTGILSNGDPAMLKAAIDHAGLAPLLDHVISVDPIRKYKTHPDAYRLGVEATGLVASDICFVSGNGWDAMAATWYGFRTLWINRRGLPFETIGPPPGRIGRDLRDVLALLPAPAGPAAVATAPA